MYYVINICEIEIVAECFTLGEAESALRNAVEESDGFYTEEDFGIADEEELDNYY